MKKITVFVIVVMSYSILCAQYYGTSTQIGNITFHNVSGMNGEYFSGTSTQIGNTTFHNISGMNGEYFSGTSTQIGNTVYNDYNSFGVRNNTKPIVIQKMYQ